MWISSVARAVVLFAVLGGLAGAVHGEVYVVDRHNGVCTGGNFDCGDGGDAQPGDGVAEIFLGGGSVSLRAAIEEANALEGHDYIVLPNVTFQLRVDLPPLTDPDGVTIISGTVDGQGNIVPAGAGEHYIFDGSAVSARLLALRDLLVTNFADLDTDMSEGLSFAETQGLPGIDVVQIVHNLGGVRQVDFDYFDVSFETGGNGILEIEDLEQFRGAGKAFRIDSPNNEILGLTIVNFHDGAIVINGEAADDNIVQGCYIGLLGTDAQDREDARLLLEEFATADGNESGGLSIGEARNVVPGLSSSAFDRIDADANDELSEAELGDAGALVDTEIAQLLLDGFDTADVDDSNSLNLAEAQTIVEALATEIFDRLEGGSAETRNGQLTVGELNAAIARGDTVGTSGAENGNKEHGIVISGGADNNLIGGSAASERNIISGNGSPAVFEVLDSEGKPTGQYPTLDFGHGILITGVGTTNNFVQGNYIGVDVSGTSPVPNAFSGIVIENGASNNTIGGTEVGEGNLITRNGSDDDGCFLHCGNGSRPYYGNGVYILDATTTDNVVLGNTITRNRTAGVKFVNLVSGTIGDAVDGAGNVISDHSLSNFVSPNIYLGNCANVQVEGNRVSGGHTGIRIFGGSNLTIGSPGFGNVFASAQQGASIFGGTDIFFYSNYVGVDETGTEAQGHNFSGMFVSGNVVNVRIGGSGDGEGNVISGNANDGIVVHSMTVGAGTAPVLFIQGNKIGTNGAGTLAIPNEVIGIRIGPDARRVMIGGTGDGEGNLISGNGEDGIRVARRLNTTGTPDNIQIFGNRIGLAATGSAQIPNGLSGVALLQVDEEVLLGGFDNDNDPATNQANTIAGNTLYGVRVKGGEVLNNPPITSHATIRGNAIYGNGVKGIFLEEAGNDDIAAPTIVGVDPINGTAPANTTVDLFADDGDQGEFYLGAAAADANGDFTLTFDIGTLQANNITATATDISAGNTSEFSEPLALLPPVFDTPPSPVTVVEGEPFSLTVSAGGSEPITYQWEVLPEGASEFVDETDDG
ncbi:MAG: hypothetical protein L3K26_12695, partial [Candidatus Hydrogenedentes bacterium]|nr:hypothetical protein [Candidatus Hydrogenedentota bacterium]